MRTECFVHGEANIVRSVLFRREVSASSEFTGLETYRTFTVAVSMRVAVAIYALYPLVGWHLVCVLLMDYSIVLEVIVRVKA